ncbi:hypothetical protein L873DRAFT_1800882 [Choiromyces venosus 120613-1]|uniref:NAD(P)-binding protein n=1 Tax=Choiromyces venosus 120613-1 TaxID=1336337 RepID=A0A3N4K285_9PEZI|nr:hypothetical protein L873DRAFT_1800882 [Choiromyces venosus 120613-1]
MRRCEVWEIDIKWFDILKAFAERAQTLPRLDVAILNAGVAGYAWNISPEGWERQLQASVLSTTLLAHLLLPKMAQTQKAFPRRQPNLVIVWSELHKATQFNERNEEKILSTLNNKEHFKKNFTSQYPITKLFNLPHR